MGTTIGSMFRGIGMVIATRRRLSLAWLVFCAAIFAPGLAWSQDQITLLADRIIISDDGSSIFAEGSVRAEYQGNIIEADQIRYDRTNGQITFPSGVVLSDSDSATLIASSGTISDSLETGQFKDVIFELAGQFRILAAELERRENGQSVLQAGIATTCEVCAENPTPFWQIRAETVLLDEEKERLFFTNAIFEFLGIPVLFAPRISTPQPGVSRASGFLVPSLNTSNSFGIGINIPYFQVLSDHSDLTFDPFISTEGALLLNAEYRRVFKNGAIRAVGAFAAEDPLSEDSSRGFVNLFGSFDLKNDFKLRFEGNAITGRTFREDYGYGDEDRIRSFVTLSKTTADRYLELSSSYTTSLRQDEDISRIPLLLPEAYLSQNYQWANGWNSRVEYQTVTLLRSSGERNSRVGTRATLDRSFIVQSGIETTLSLRGDAAVYNVTDQVGFDDGTYSYAVPTFAATTRFPLQKRHSNGGYSQIEPIFQVIWSPDSAGTVPNEDSLQLEFEDSNLFTFTRFPGFDAVELGARANVGLRYMYVSPNDWRLGLVVGQVFRDKDLGQFTSSAVAGLTGQRSDTVVAVNFDYLDRLAFNGRALIDRDTKVSKFETQLDYNYGDWAVSFDYIFLEDDVILADNDTQNQIRFRTSYQATPNWKLKLDVQHDFENGSPIEQILGAEFRNDCIALDFRYAIDYAAGGGAEIERTFGLAVEILGFGSEGSSNGRKSTC
ncbi:MAG: LPS assembly protein LptD [Pseudomonadota bacterium]